ncbi:hypothetical protein HK096_010768 [Nowakowskiella sp. JEL0078]|nr:hypothetical protein HK096_010768 [Nowakowskiella sp. JEL0078]
MSSTCCPPSSPYFLTSPQASLPVMEMQKAVLWQTDGFLRNISQKSNASFNSGSSSKKTFSHVSGQASTTFSDGNPGLYSGTLLKQYPCDQIGCYKSYTRKYNLISHQLSSHSHIRPYTCRVFGCSASFSRPHDLRRHTQCIHSSYRPFKCQACNMSFARSDALKRHTDRDEGRRSKGGKGCEDVREFKRMVEANTIIEYSNGAFQIKEADRSILYSQFSENPIKYQKTSKQNSMEIHNIVSFVPQDSQEAHSSSFYNSIHDKTAITSNHTSYDNLQVPSEKYLPISPISKKSYYEFSSKTQNGSTEVPITNQERILPSRRTLKIMDLLN